MGHTTRQEKGGETRIFIAWTLLGAGILVSVLLCNAAATGVFLVLGIISPGPMNDVLEIALFVVSAGVTIGLVAVAISKIWKGIKRNH